MLYFGYGSNLCSADLAAWCDRRGLDRIVLTPAAAAFLPDRRLAFTHRSTTRGGGVLDVPEAVGSAVAGILFEVSPEHAAALDRKEGEGHTYRRFEAVALTAEGGERAAFAYEVVPEGREPHVSPPEGYLDAVRRGYAEHGVATDALEAAAADRAHPGPVTHLFVYGTLMNGEERHPAIVRHRLAAAGAATTPGTLYDLGSYPGLVTDSSGRAVRGELYKLDGAAAAIAALDAIEEFRGFGEAGSQYRRAIVRVECRESVAALAWTYVLATVRDEARAIASGDWRMRHAY